MRLQVARLGVDLAAAGDVAVVDARAQRGLRRGRERVQLLAVGTRAVRAARVAPHARAVRARGEARRRTNRRLDRRRRRAAHFAAAGRLQRRRRIVVQRIRRRHVRQILVRRHLTCNFF